MRVEHIELPLVFSTDLSEPFALYLMDEDGRHYGGEYFRPEPNFGELSSRQALVKALHAIGAGEAAEVRVTNAADELLLLWHGSVIHPANTSLHEAFKKLGAK
jgi:hypothetical protein